VERVDGIGGFFFAARDPDALSRWYADHLGVALPPATYDDEGWRQSAGPTVFAPFEDGPGVDNPHLGAGGWGLNLRVRDLDAMVRQLEAAGIEVAVDPETNPNGRFASLSDPEGNAVQLWEVAGS
jgi:glyoxylase I family protein